MSGNSRKRELPEGTGLHIRREGGLYLGLVIQDAESRGSPTVGLSIGTYECSTPSLHACVRKLMEHATRPKAKFSPTD